MFLCLCFLFLIGFVFVTETDLKETSEEEKQGQQSKNLAAHVHSGNSLKVVGMHGLHLNKRRVNQSYTFVPSPHLLWSYRRKLGKHKFIDKKLKTIISYRFEISFQVSKYTSYSGLQNLLSTLNKHIIIIIIIIIKNNVLTCVSFGLNAAHDSIASVNPLRPNNDESQTSHCNIKGVSVGEVMRIENMITQVKFY